MQLNSYTDANQVTGANINTENIAYKANLFSKIYTYGLQMRRSEKDYLNRLQDKYIKKYEAALAKSIQLTDIFYSVAVTADEKSKIKHVISGLNASGEQFSKVVAMAVKLGLTPDTGLKGELRRAVHKVEEIISIHASLQDPKVLM
ncbi:MAG: hypothetical protein HRU28_05710 [Rhizobiales bacterium]|nr:hypothetical protein [Hyphomicrobiales bacterium]